MSVGRREFITTAAVSGVQWLGAAQSRAAANDRIRAAVIGMGGRGRDHMRELARIPFVEVAAFCDPDANRLDEKVTEFEKLTGKKPTLYQDVRKLLDDKSIDAVTIATCNHWHALAAIWACQAGKHVYVEKPVCHDFFSGAQMVAASRKYNKLMQGGTQRRSSPTIRRAIQALHDGIIGDVYMARCIHYERRNSIGFKEPSNPPDSLNWDVWVGPAPMQPYNANLHPYNWHWFWDFGNGELGNNGIHYIDVARWGLNKALPSRIYSTGGRFGYKDQAQTPNVQLSTYVFEDGTELVAEIRGRFSNPEGETSFGNMFYGSKGYMISDPRHESFKVFLEGKTTPEPDLGRVEDPAADQQGRVSHFRNFFDAVQAGKREMLNADINETYLSTAYCLLGNISYRVKRELRFDPGTRRFHGDAEANAMLKEKYRAPYIIPDRV